MEEQVDKSRAKRENERVPPPFYRKIDFFMPRGRLLLAEDLDNITVTCGSLPRHLGEEHHVAA